jgi:hypothetical protein
MMMTMMTMRTMLMIMMTTTMGLLVLLVMQSFEQIASLVRASDTDHVCEHQSLGQRYEKANERHNINHWIRDVRNHSAPIMMEGD